jgi:hypothetical protein
MAAGSEIPDRQHSLSLNISLTIRPAGLAISFTTDCGQTFAIAVIH